MAAIRVHGTPYSTPMGQVLAILYEKELEFELVVIDMKAGEHKKESFLSINVRKGNHASMFVYLNGMNE